MITINEDILVKSLAQSVKNGKITLEQVPDNLKDKVQEILDK
jgi:hypothetical protein